MAERNSRPTDANCEGKGHNGGHTWRSAVVCAECGVDEGQLWHCGGGPNPSYASEIVVQVTDDGRTQVLRPDRGEPQELKAGEQVRFKVALSISAEEREAGNDGDASWLDGVML